MARGALHESFLMGAAGTEILIIFLLLLGNGVFAMTEMAVVSARKTRLKQLADEGDLRAAAALALASEPNRFLSTVQVGITLVGVLAGAFGGATLAGEIAAKLRHFPVLQPHASSLSVATVVIGITYFSLIIGELVPKRLALGNPEAIARLMAGPMNAISRLASPVVWFLGVSTDIVLKALGVRAPGPQAMSNEEIQVMMEEGMKAGVFHDTEPRMVESVLALDHLPVSEIMTPRTKIIFLNNEDSHEAVWHKIVVSGHSAFPVFESSRDNVVGMVTVKAIYANLAAGARATLADLLTTPLIVPATQSVTQLLDAFKSCGRHVALVANEFGDIVGLITLVDVLEAIVGEIESPAERLKPVAKRRDDGTWLVDGALEVERLADLLPDLPVPGDDDRTCQTVAGLALARFGRVPAEGESFTWAGHRFEIIDMDRHRIDKLLIERLPATA